MIFLDWFGVQFLQPLVFLKRADERRLAGRFLIT
jgi:hypothetical protein